MKMPKLNAYKLVLELVSLFAVVLCTVYTVHNASTEHILLAAVDIIIYLTLTGLMCLPEIMRNPNTPWKLKDGFEEQITEETLCLMSELKLSLGVIFAYMIVMTDKLNVAVIVMLSLLPILALFMRMSRIKKYKA